MNMSGTALYEGCVVLFVAQVYGVPLGLVSQVRESTTLVCHANYDAMRGLLDFLAAECCAEETECKGASTAA